ncbi:tRNA glutamyl-Q(34) synthetase GluQRS [Pararhizobium sp.]|uniref:tRNA glutamyl-Q(34) synthetase GluQRS n=1 Tax=Pararhizobium sp. TaxID=1977563 RepID=UPI0027197C44|nr:tRNA glutamyl-Q(34) synthetase GluQRS [Pararhizobium sp.]MDO9417947.1 tRNA glutamyl-Q(34) synthetase GluQRS [Pararhizobium sp.]
MRPTPPPQPIFRFAPSPNGLLHLGHARSALINQEMAKAADGRLLLRIEDIDQTRCHQDYEAAIYRDLSWLGMSWEEPVRRQSQHFDLYRQTLDALIGRGLAYPGFLTRGEVKTAVAAYEEKGAHWPRDPDGAPLYPLEERELSPAVRAERIAGGEKHAWRLNMEKALAETGPPDWLEVDQANAGNRIAAGPAIWGDIILSRSDAPSSYHLSVTLDDALQGVTHVVRGQDLFQATSVHRLLQVLLDLPEPVYHHHALVLGPDGRKLSKSNADTGIAAFRDAGHTPDDIRALVL